MLQYDSIKGVRLFCSVLPHVGRLLSDIFFLNCQLAAMLLLTTYFLCISMLHLCSEQTEKNCRSRKENPLYPRGN